MTSASDPDEIVTVLLPEDEYTHVPDEAENYNESMYLNAFDLGLEAGGWFRLGNRVNEGYAEMSVCIYLPDGRVGFMFGRPHIDTNDAMDAGILSRDHRLKLLTGRLAAVSPEQQTGRARAELAHVGDRLEKAMARQLERKSERVKRLASQVRALDPTGVLARGYSILLDESQKAVKSHADVAVGTTLRAVLHDGSLDATVTGAKEK